MTVRSSMLTARVVADCLGGRESEAEVAEMMVEEERARMIARSIAHAPRVSVNVQMQNADFWTH